MELGQGVCGWGIGEGEEGGALRQFSSRAVVQAPGQVRSPLKEPQKPPSVPLTFMSRLQRLFVAQERDNITLPLSSAARGRGSSPSQQKTVNNSDEIVSQLVQATIRSKHLSNKG